MIVLAGIVAALIGVVVILVIWLIVGGQNLKTAKAKYLHLLDEYVEHQAGEKDRVATIRKDAIARSTSVVKGKVAEHMVPFNKTFGFNPRDCRFIGSPIDFVVFDGLTEGDLERVVLVEVKTGKSRLSKRERQVRDAIAYENLVFLTFRVDDEGEGTWSHLT